MTFLYTILGPAFGTLVFLDMATILWSIHPMDLDTALKQIYAALVKVWSMNVDDVIPVLFVTTLVGCLISWSRLEALVTVRIFFLSGQLDESQSIFKSPRKYTSVDITYIINHFTHVIQMLTVSNLVVYSSFPPEWALGEVDEPVAILLQQYLTLDRL